MSLAEPDKGTKSDIVRLGQVKFRFGHSNFSNNQDAAISKKVKIIKGYVNKSATNFNFLPTALPGTARLALDKSSMDRMFRYLLVSPAAGNR